MIIVLKESYITFLISIWNSSKRSVTKSFLPPKFDTPLTISVTHQAFRKQLYPIRKAHWFHSAQLLKAPSSRKYISKPYQLLERENLRALSSQYEWISLIKYIYWQFRCSICRGDPKNGTFLLPFRFFRLWKFIRNLYLLWGKWKIWCACCFRIP